MGFLKGSSNCSLHKMKSSAKDCTVTSEMLNASKIYTNYA